MTLAKFEVLSRNFPGETEENHERPITITGLLTEVSNRNLLNTKLESWPLRFHVRLLSLQQTVVITRSVTVILAYELKERDVQRSPLREPFHFS